MIYVKVFDKIQISLTYFYLDENCWNNKFCWKLCFRHGILGCANGKIKRSFYFVKFFLENISLFIENISVLGSGLFFLWSIFGHNFYSCFLVVAIVSTQIKGFK